MPIIRVIISETFKFYKSKLIDQAFDYTKIRIDSPNDAIFMESSGGYVPLTNSLLDSICSGDIII